MGAPTPFRPTPLRTAATPAHYSQKDLTMKSTSATATHGPWRVTGLNGSALTCTPVGRARRQGLWWLHYGPAQWPGLDEGVELVGHASAARERALIGAVDLVDRLSNDVRLSGWTFHIRPEPEQRRVTVIGTVPR